MTGPRTYAFLLPLFLSLGCAQIQAPPAGADRPEDLRAFLKKHPEIIMEVLKENKGELLAIVLEAGQEAEKAKRRENVLSYLQKPLDPDLDPARPVLGQPNTPMVIVVYSDFLCSACAEGSRNIAELMRKYPDQIRLYLRHLPSDELSNKISLYFEAIAMQDPEKAWQFYHEAMANQSQIEETKMAGVQKIIDSLNLDQTRLAKDVADPILETRLERDSEEAEEFRLESTPSYIVNGVPVDGAAPLEVFEDVIHLWKERNQGS